MSMRDQAIDLVESELNWYHDEIDSSIAGEIIGWLDEKGYLAPDLPEPEVRHIEEVEVDILVWESDHISVGVYKNWISIDDPLGSSVSPSEARELAHALLAAANYAEKEQDNE